MESTRASSAPVHTSSDIGTYPVSSLASRRRPQPLQAVYVRAQVVKDQQTRWGGDVGRHRQRRVARLHDGNLAATESPTTASTSILHTHSPWWVSENR